MAQLRFIRMDYNYADFSTGVSPAIERALEERKSTSTVVLNIFKGDSFTIGLLDDPEKCLDLDYCRREKVVVQRRQNTGGVILGPDGSAFICMYLDTKHPWTPMKTIKDAFRITLTGLADTARELFDIDALYRPLNDVEVGGRKLIASSARLENNILTMRLLLNVVPTNRDRLTKAIKIPIEKVRDKKIKTIGERFTCLEEEIGRKITDNDLVTFTKRSVERIFGGKVKLVPGELTELEREYAAEYQEKYTSEEWFYANSERLRFRERPADAIKAEGLHKAPAGLIRITLLVRHNTIHDLIITGDFHPSPHRVIREMEDAIKGQTVNPDIIREEVQRVLERPDVEIPGTQVDDFVQAFTKAFEKIQQ